jgi:hypothetical protein
MSEEIVKRGPGRPKGSKNKPKAQPEKPNEVLSSIAPAPNTTGAGVPAGQIFGVRPVIPISECKTLDDVWGRKFSKFGTTNREEYEGGLRKKIKLDLQHECIKMGRRPMDDREQMIKRLLSDFDVQTALCKTSGMKPAPQPKLSAAAAEVLRKYA